MCHSFRHFQVRDRQLHWCSYSYNNYQIKNSTPSTQMSEVGDGASANRIFLCILLRDSKKIKGKSRLYNLHIRYLWKRNNTLSFLKLFRNIFLWIQCLRNFHSWRSTWRTLLKFHLPYSKNWPGKCQTFQVFKYFNFLKRLVMRWVMINMCWTNFFDNITF